MKLKPIITAILAFSVSGCMEAIGTGNVGVERTLKKVKEEPLMPGLYGETFCTIDEFTTKEILMPLDSMTPTSKDTLTMKDVDIDIYYRINPSFIPKLYVKYQGDVAPVSMFRPEGGNELIAAPEFVRRNARSVVYSVIAGFDSTTMHTKRDLISVAVQAKLQEELDRTDKGVFQVTSVNVRSLVIDPTIEQAIKEKVAVEEQTRKKELENGLATAEAARLVIEAQGQADANRIISESLTPTLVTLKLAELQRDTALSIASKEGNTVLLGGNATPLVNIK